MRILICGDRKWADVSKIEAVVKTLSRKEDLVIEGGASGADTIAGRMARKYGIPLAEFPAHWDFYDLKAGHLRNGWMLKFGLPDRVVAFHSCIERSRGTADMVRRARLLNLPVEIVT